MKEYIFFIIKEIFQLFLRLSKGLYYLHKNGFIHGYLTTRSIIISSDAQIDGYMLPDFNYPYIAIKGRKIFEAPEKRDAKAKLTEAMDVYSLGKCILCYAKSYKIKSRVELGSGVKHCIDLCIDSDPKKRPSSKELYHRLSMTALGVKELIKKLEKNIEHPKSDVLHRIRYLCKHSKHNIKRLSNTHNVDVLVKVFPNCNCYKASLDSVLIALTMAESIFYYQ